VQTRLTQSSTAFSKSPTGTALAFLETQIQSPFETGHILPVGDAKDICCPDTQCQSFGGARHTYFRALNSTSEFGIFLGLVGSSHTAPDALCSVQGGGGNFPDQKWLSCANDFDNTRGNLSRYILNTYQLPPDQIHTECLQNPKCIGFRIKNDRSSGDLLRRVTADSPGWFKGSGPSRKKGGRSKANQAKKSVVFLALINQEGKKPPALFVRAEFLDA
jgi:hypothetical protein